MKNIYKICGKVSLICYLLLIYQIWHLCQYGGVKSHLPILVVAAVGFIVSLVLWLVSRSIYGKTDSIGSKKNKIFYVELLIIIIATVGFGGLIGYSAIPYNGALSWKIDDLFHKKKVELDHNNLFKYGIEGILSDLERKLELPTELYVANEFRVDFDENGTIQTIYAFIYGKDGKGQEKSYLIDYDANTSEDMTVWLDGNTSDKYEESMKLAPMMDIIKKANWASQVKMWSLAIGEDQTYEILYMGKREFTSPEGLECVSDDGADIMKLAAGGKIAGYEVSLHVPKFDNITPVRYIMDPEYISQSVIDKENTDKQIDEAKNDEGWTLDQSTGTVYFFLNDNMGYSLVITDAAAGIRFYSMDMTDDGGNTWTRINDDPFGGQIGVAEGIEFFDENFGIIGLTGPSQSASSLYITRDGGKSFNTIQLPFDTVDKLPDSAKDFGYVLEDYDYMNMPKKEANVYTIIVTTDATENDGIVFESEDDGNTWKVKGVTE